MLKIMSIIGTRPEAIKMAPIILELEKKKAVKSVVVVTGQHRELVDQMLDFFKIKPKYDLDVMQKNQTLSSVTARILERMEEVVAKEKPNLILVQGDTTTVFVAALIGFYHRIKVGHVEAGLRSFDKFQPYPEEINRKLTSALTDIHFAPTKLSRQNLLNEGVKPSQIVVCGNSVIDALLATSKIKYSYENKVLSKMDFKKNRVVLVTAHRRENFDTGIANICQAINKLTKLFPDIQFIYPVHPNPNVAEPVKKLIGKNKQVNLIEPLDYQEFVNLMKDSYLVLTDSGGVQEEAPSLGKPVLVMRNTTERPEGVTAGTSKLVGTDVEKIVREVSKLLKSKTAYKQIARRKNPYGNGQTAQTIVKTILKRSKEWME